MPVIQPGVLPVTPATPTFGDYLGQGIGTGASHGMDLLMQAFLKGQLAQVPTQGQYTAPSGQGTFLSPAEQVAGNPTMTLSDALQRAQRPPGAQFAPAGMHTQFLPGLDRQLQQAQLQNEQAKNALIPSEQAKNQAETQMLMNQGKYYGQFANAIGGTGGPGGADAAGGMSPIFYLDQAGQHVAPGTAGARPFGLRMGRLGPEPYPLALTPGEQAQGSIGAEQAKAGATIPAAIRELDVMNKQFANAFPAPAGQETQPAIQRAAGEMAKLGATFGFPRPTPAQTALIKAMPLAAIGVVRLAGGVGRVSNQELNAATESLQQQGLTPAERYSLAKTISEQYLARVAPADWQTMVKQNPDLPSILTKYGIQAPTTGGGMGVVDPHVANLQQQYPGAKITRIK